MKSVKMSPVSVSIVVKRENQHVARHYYPQVLYCGITETEEHVYNAAHSTLHFAE